MQKTQKTYEIRYTENSVIKKIRTGRPDFILTTRKNIKIIEIKTL